jgi:hypothetical protein
MQELDDIALLREYAERDSEEAFAKLVTRHVNKVYSVALQDHLNAMSKDGWQLVQFIETDNKFRVVMSRWKR